MSEMRTLGGQIIRVEPRVGDALGIQLGDVSGGLDLKTAEALCRALAGELRLEVVKGPVCIETECPHFNPDKPVPAPEGEGQSHTCNSDCKANKHECDTCTFNTNKGECPYANLPELARCSKILGRNCFWKPATPSPAPPDVSKSEGENVLTCHKCPCVTLPGGFAQCGVDRIDVNMSDPCRFPAIRDAILEERAKR